MSFIYARPVRPDGSVGDAICSAASEGAGVVYYGDSDFLRRKIPNIAMMYKITDREAFNRLAEDGWSNGYMSISA